MVLTIFDLLLTPIYLLIIYFIAAYHQKVNERKEPLYKWYTKGLFVKFLGGISVCFIYQFYYKGGDTVNYYETSKVLLNLSYKNFGVFWDVLKGNNTHANYSYFDYGTGWPVFWRDPKALFVSIVLVPLQFLSFKSYIITTILLAWLSYTGIWKLFLLFNREFPKLQKQLAISILFIPSVVFWGSGLLKDTITLSAIGWYTYHFYYFFIKRNYTFWSAFCVFFSSYILISVKPYILFALLPGTLIWLSNERLKTINSTQLRTIFAPLFIGTGALIGFLFLSQLDESLGVYSLDKVLDKAVESNLDQKSDHYGGSSFDIGHFDANVFSMASKAHLAISYGLFSPFLWNVRNPVMLLSALENSYILLLTLFLVIRLRIWGFFQLIGKKPLILFSILFSLFFAFSVGLATSNFGSLVRLKIPCIPFYVSSLFVLKFFYDEKISKVRKRS